MLRWIKDKRKDFREKIEEREVSWEGEGRKLQERWERLIKGIWEVGRELKMVKEIREDD